MRFNRARRRHNCATDRRAGFTLAEVLAALAFLAIVIPVVLQGLRVASLAGQVGARKAVAARIAERMLNEWVVTAQSRAPAQSGLVEDGVQEYRWSIQQATWSQDAMRVLTAQVFFTVQGEEYDVSLTTLLDGTGR